MTDKKGSDTVLDMEEQPVELRFVIKNKKLSELGIDWDTLRQLVRAADSAVAVWADGREETL